MAPKQIDTPTVNTETPMQTVLRVLGASSMLAACMTIVKGMPNPFDAFIVSEFTVPEAAQRNVRPWPVRKGQTEPTGASRTLAIATVSILGIATFAIRVLENFAWDASNKCVTGEGVVNISVPTANFHHVIEATDEKAYADWINTVTAKYFDWERTAYAGAPAIKVQATAIKGVARPKANIAPTV